MARYKLTRKENRLNSSESGKWYAIPINESLLDTDIVCREACKHTSFTPFELNAGLDLLSGYIPLPLKQGHSVRLGRLGTLRLSYSSEGADSPEQFNTHLIRPPKLVFTPSKELMQAITSDLHFENGGVIDGGISFPSLADYKKFVEQQEQNK